MVIQSLNGAPVPSTPLRPSALSTFSLAARMKRGGGARRALSTLGPNDTQANLRLAESLLTVSQEKFVNKWNFDPVNIVPLAPGRYQWTPVSSPAEPKGTSIKTNTKDILTCFTLPKSGFSHPTTEPRVPAINQCPAAEVSVTSCPDTKVQDNNDSGIETDESFSESPSAPSRSPSTSQTTITDYLRCSKKRLLVIDDADVERLTASKRRQQGEGSVKPGLSSSSTSNPASATSPTSATSSVLLPETPSVLQK